MKTVKVLLMVILTSGFGWIDTTNAQSPQPEMTISRVVNQSADGIWEIIRQMDDIEQYSSVIETLKWRGPKGKGGQRICYGSDGQSYYKERIISFSDETRTYTYEMLEGVPTKGMKSTFKVVDLGFNKSMIVWYTHYDEFIDNPQMDEEQFSGFVSQTINELIDNMTREAIKV